MSQTSPGSTSISQTTPFWRDERVLRAFSQILSAVLIIGFLVWVGANLFGSAQQRGLSLGYDFLDESAGFPIGESVIEYDPARSFGYAFGVGVLNTLKVALVGILLATVLGTVVGLARLSDNWLLSRIALVYIELHRNIPLLVLLFLWYFAVFSGFPSVQEAIVWPGPIYLSKRGLFMVWGKLNPGGEIWIASLIVGILLSTIVFFSLRKRREVTGRPTYFGGISLALLVGLPLAGWFLSGGQPIQLTYPQLEQFNFQGGMELTPEFAALLVGLVTYTAAFIAEVVRAGIQAVDRGQLEAARAVGLSHSQILLLVIIPQALRVIIPPLISQYLNLTKNSSLALAIGYPDLFTVGRIMINQAGRAVPVFGMIMASYLAMSLITSVVLNVYNRRIQFVQR
jgi:general L-amino acid transport system permease protein